MHAHFSVTCTVNQKQPIFQEFKIHVHMTIDTYTYTIQLSEYRCNHDIVHHTQLSKYQKLHTAVDISLHF